MADADNTSITWTAEALALGLDPRPWIGGRRGEPLSTGTFESRNPATGACLVELPNCGTPDIDSAVRAAREVFDHGDWSGQSPRDRAKKMHTFAEIIASHAQELALLDSLEMGMPVRNAFADMQDVVDQIHAVAEMADKLLDDVIPNDPHALVLNVHEPVGVVGAITPWNFPAYIGITKIAPALAVGNSVVLKPSEIASLSCLRLGELAAEAGIPNGVLNVVPGRGSEAGEALALHMEVDLLTFTGSTTTGRRLLELSGESNMKRLILECGGKSPHIVFPDINDLDGLADAIVGGITFNTGQVCVAGSRLIVHRSIHDAIVDRVADRARLLRSGDPLDESTTLGPLASTAQLDRVRGLFESGRRQGAAVTLDGSTPTDQAGCYWLPTIFTAVHSEMQIAREEIFGPILSVLVFDSDEEAVAIANGTIYGLTATVWTRDLPRALKMARSISAGAVTIAARSDGGRVDATTGAFEPHRQSGLGVEGGLGGMRSFTRLKSVTFKG